MSVRPPSDVRRRLAGVSLVLAGVVLGWSALLIVTGGFTVTLLGVTLRSHNPARPALAGLFALVVFTCAAGPRRVWISIRSFAGTSDTWLAARTLPTGVLAGVLAVAVCGWGLYRGSGIAGGADSYGYVSQAELWLRGLPIVPQPWTADVPWPGAAWTFSPLGYRPTPDGTALVPVYAVGLPLIMAATKLVAGHAAMFWLTPVAAGVLVLVAYVAGRRLDSPAVGITTAWLVATNATLISEVASPMSDVVAAAALASSFYLLWDPRHVPVTAGVIAAIAVAVRPNLASTLAIMALWMAVRRPSEDGSHRLRRVAHACMFLAAASPGVLLPAWANWRLFGSPFVSGYGDLASIYDWSHVLPNLAQYSRLLLGSHSWPVLLGLGVVLVPIARLWPRLADRSIPPGIALFVFSLVAQYLAYEFAAGAGYLRLLLPCLPFAMAATARLLVAVARPGWPALLVALAVVAQGVVSAHYTGRDDQLGERKYPGAGAIVRTHTSPASVIYAFQHSGSLRYYGGRLTLRYDLLEPAWLDRSVEWFAQRGTHVYAVLDDWEVPVFRQRFAGQQRVRQIDRPLVTYRGTVVVHLYDLGGAAPGQRPAKEWVDRFDGPRYPRPAAPAAVPWKR